MTSSDQLPVRVLHRYRRGQGLNPGKPAFFTLSFHKYISCVFNFDDLLHFFLSLILFLHPAVQIYEIHMFIIS